MTPNPPPTPDPRGRDVQTHAGGTPTVAGRALLIAPLALLSLPAGYAAGRAAAALAGSAELRRDLVGDLPRWVELLANTLAVVGVTLVVLLPAALFASAVATRVAAAGRGWILGLAGFGACLPGWSTTVFIAAWIDFNRWFHSLWLCGALYAALWLPLATLLLALGWRSVDRRLEELALLDAAAARVAWHVSLPAMRGVLLAVALLVALLTAADNTLSDLLAVRTFAEEVYTQFSLHFAAPAAMLTAAPLMLGLAAVLLIGRSWLAPLAEVERAAGERSVDLWRPRRLAAFVLVAAGLLAAAPAALLGLPVALARIGSWRVFFDATWLVWPEIANSLQLAVITAAPLALLAVPWAWVLLRRGRWSSLARGLLVLLLATPATVTGLSLVELTSGPGWLGALRDSPAIVVLGYAIRFAPLAALLLVPAALRIPPALEEAARLDGCGDAAFLRHVVFPLCRRDLLPAGLILLMLCYGEVICTHLVAPPAWRTAGVRAFTLSHFGLYADLAVLGLWGALTTAAAWWVLRRLFAGRRTAWAVEPATAERKR